MKRSIKHLMILMLPVMNTHLCTAQQYRFSNGLYRIPYENGVSVKVGTNVWNHDPLGCFDMWGTGGSSYNIVAAAGGWIRAIRDFNDISCNSEQNCCNQYNNYIVLEHPNGEWSTYIHLQKNSITNLGHQVGNWVNVGTVLGKEGDVGCASSSHLHLEISRPFDPTNAWEAYDGVLRRHGELLNPVFCNVSTGYLAANTTYTANNCNDNCNTNITTSGTPSNIVLRADNSINSTQVFNSSSTGMYRAGTQVVLTAGFEAKLGTMFCAQIKQCNEQ